MKWKYMDGKAAVPKLDSEWDEETGFFGRLRHGIFDQDGFQRVINILELVDTSGEQLDSRFVSLTWFIPTFMEWQRVRVRERGGTVHDLDHAQQVIIELLFKVLGTP